MKILFQKNCVSYHVVHSRRYYDCAHNGLQMCTEDSQNIWEILQTYKKRTIFILGKLTGVQTLFPVLIVSIKLEHNKFYCEKWTERLRFTSQHIHTHVIHGVSRLEDFIAGGDFLGLCDQKIQINTCPNMDRYGVMTAWNVE